MLQLWGLRDRVVGVNIIFLLFLVIVQHIKLLIERGLLHSLLLQLCHLAKEELLLLMTIPRLNRRINVTQLMLLLSLLIVQISLLFLSTVDEVLLLKIKSV